MHQMKEPLYADLCFELVHAQVMFSMCPGRYV